MTTRRNRFRREPRGQGYRITDNDIRILELLHRFGFLPSSYITAFLPDRNELALRHRLTLLRHDAGLIETPKASWQAANARYRPAVYQLTNKGEALLQARCGLVPRRKSNAGFKHELIVSLFHASLALGLREHPSIRFIDHREIMAHPVFKGAAGHGDDSFRMPLRLRYRSPQSGLVTAVDTSIRHDGEPFGLCFQGNGTKRYLFFPGIEADRRTEPLSPRSPQRSSIRKHFSKILEAFQSDLYRRHLGLPNALVPVLTTSQEHMQSMIALMLELTNGAGSRGILFKAIPDFATCEGYPPPGGGMLTEPWQRAGHAPYAIIDALQLCATRRKAA